LLIFAASRQAPFTSFIEVNYHHQLVNCKKNYVHHHYFKLENLHNTWLLLA
jgi:hypothetical protein